MAKKSKKVVESENMVQEFVADESTLETDMQVVDTIVEDTPVVEKKTKKTKKENQNKTIVALTNSELLKLFHENGCRTRSNPNDSSSVVYNTFGTQSRVLQQTKAYQLLLTNGHKSTKAGIESTDNDDTARFIEWYNTLTDEQKSWVVGYESMTVTKLASTEMPRERQVKLTNLDLLVQFIKYMGTFAENQLA